MLHEVLLALSGHPSPLFKDNDPSLLQSEARHASEEFPLLSPSEKTLLQSIGQLSDLHRKLKHHINQIVSHHPSTICRAVAISIQEVHLTRFQDKVLTVESKILSKDATLVGAYEIVPLAGVVGEFDDWHRRMAWYWDMACFMQNLGPKSNDAPRCTGAAMIDKLRAEQQTGFPDIEAVAIELSKVAETAWLRQLASWMLYGKLPSFGSDDFFIRARQSEAGEDSHFSRDKDLLPKFVVGSTASSILFVGKSLHQVRKYGRQPGSRNALPSRAISESELAAAHLQHLSALSLPLVPAQLSRAVSAIKLSLSHNVLQHLLPMEMTLELLSALKQFFLLSRGEFALALITEADERLQARQASMGRLLQQDPVKALQGLSIKDTELQQTLASTWKALASRDEEIEDEILDFGRKHISLSAPTEHDSRPSTSDSFHSAASNLTSIAFNDLLFPTAVSLGMTITPPQDLFISQREIEAYSTINAYLLSIRRAHLRLSDLWRRTAARRDHPAPKGVSETADARQRVSHRRIATRKVWASCSAAIFLLSETSAYFEGEIIRESWDCFETWVQSKVPNDGTETSTLIDNSATSDTVVQRDPEALSSGHRAFLAALTYALLLTDVPYTADLRSLLGNIDHLIAFFTRLLDIQQKRDVEADTAAGESSYTAEEEQRISLELDRARKKVDSDLKSVVKRLRGLDQQRIGAGRYLSTSIPDSGFEPWRGRGVDRLLMKLEFGRVAEQEEGFDVV